MLWFYLWFSQNTDNQLEPSMHRIIQLMLLVRYIDNKSLHDCSYLSMGNWKYNMNRFHSNLTVIKALITKKIIYFIQVKCLFYSSYCILTPVYSIFLCIAIFGRKPKPSLHLPSNSIFSSRFINEGRPVPKE